MTSSSSGLIQPTPLPSLNAARRWAGMARPASTASGMCQEIMRTAIRYSPPANSSGAALSPRLPTRTPCQAAKGAWPLLRLCSKSTPRDSSVLAKPSGEALAKKFNSSVFPGQQGGPLEHVIAAKAVAFKLAAAPEFRERQQRTLDGAAILAERLLQDDSRAAGINVVSGGTDVHLVLVDLRESELDGKQAEDRLHRAGITVNRNAVPFDPRPPMVSSGVRIGTAALATRGFDLDSFREVADVISHALRPGTDDAALAELRARVDVLADRFPLYPNLTEASL